MSTDTKQGDDLEERISNFLRKNFPQIQMHGGSASITNIDRESGEVSIRLSGACSGCGISPMTVQAIKSRMAKEIPEVKKVHADTGGGEDTEAPSFPSASEGDEGGSTSDAPF